MTTNYETAVKVLTTKEGLIGFISAMADALEQQNRQYQGGVMGEFRRRLASNRGQVELGFSPSTGKEYYIRGNAVYERSYTRGSDGYRVPHHRKIEPEHIPLDAKTSEEIHEQEQRDREFWPLVKAMLKEMGVPESLIESITSPAY